MHVQGGPGVTKKPHTALPVWGLIFTQPGRRDLNPRPPEPHTRATPRDLFARVAHGGRPAHLSAPRAAWASALAIEAPVGCARAAAAHELASQRPVRAVQPNRGVVRGDAEFTGERCYARAFEVHSPDGRSVLRLQGLHELRDAGAHLVTQSFIGSRLGLICRARGVGKCPLFGRLVLSVAPECRGGALPPPRAMSYASTAGLQ